MRGWTVSTMLLCCHLLSVVMLLASAQNYHFSQGWLPGRKRSRPPIVDSDNDVAVDTLQLMRLLRSEYKRQTAAAAAAAAAVKQSIDGSPADDIRPFNFIANPAHQYTRFLRLVMRISLLGFYSNYTWLYLQCSTTIIGVLY